MRKFKVMPFPGDLVGCDIAKLIRDGHFDIFVGEQEECGFKFVCFVQTASFGTACMFEEAPKGLSTDQGAAHAMPWSVR